MNSFEMQQLREEDRRLLVYMTVAFAGGFFGALNISPHLDVQALLKAIIAGAAAAFWAGKAFLEVPHSKR